MWILAVASAYASCLNVTVSPSECVGGEAVQVVVDCDGGPLPARWNIELQQDGGDYGALVDLGELVDGVAEGTCVDPGLPCDSGQTSYLYAVATDGEGGQDWAFTRLLVKAPACAAPGARDSGDEEAGLAAPEDEPLAESSPEAEAPESGGCGAGGGGLASAGLLLLGLGRVRREAVVAKSSRR